MIERPQLVTVVDPAEPADVELDLAVVDEALIELWRAEVTLPDGGDTATLLASLL